MHSYILSLAFMTVRHNSKGLVHETLVAVELYDILAAGNHADVALMQTHVKHLLLEEN